MRVWVPLALWSVCGLALAAGPATAPVAVAAASSTLAVDGVVEAVRQSDLSSQVPGRVTALLVKAGDRVKAGQVLLRVDERVAQQQAQASRSQVTALAAQQHAASQAYARTQRLHAQGFLSAAALERAESEFKATQAQTQAQMAQAQAAVTQTDQHTLVAPYAGVVSQVNTELGAMAAPGVALVTLYDPSALRVSVNVPQTRISTLQHTAVQIDIPAAPAALKSLQAASMTVLPSADVASQTVQVRLALPSGSNGLMPGMFARAHLPQAASDTDQRLSVPAQAVFRRGDMTAVYVLDDKGQAQLRLVRTGRKTAGSVEVLAGLSSGEKVVLEPLAVTPKR